MFRISFIATLKSTIRALLASIALYTLFLSSLTIPLIQNQVIYLNRGFLRNQVSPFKLSTPDGETLHAWHILPLELYRRHEQELIEEPTGLVPDITDRLGFKLLRDDPSSLLVLYFHGAAGTLGSGWRPPSYRAMSAGAPRRTHVLAIDYRGFGASSGVPSEEGLLVDSVALAEWAMQEAGIPPSRIVLFAQSLGTAVSIALAQHMATRADPVLFSGMVLVAPFADVELLTATYRVAGTIPILDLIARFPRLLAWLNTFVLSKWPSKDTLAEFVRSCEKLPAAAPKYHVTIIHAEDDYDIPWSHSEQLFWHAANATLPDGIGFDELEREKAAARSLRRERGWVVERRTKQGVIREEIMKYGLHDRIMSYPVVSSAVMRAFENSFRPYLDDTPT
ncbi:alpha/beta-hydrolase [Whalleya microplaca]|nr:alpha/beta-hydrolase [Whalleya microplaca]